MADSSRSGSQAGLLFAKIVHESSGKEFDLGYLKRGVVVETMDLSGPRFMFEFDDPNSYLRDTVGLNELDAITVHISDQYARDGFSQTLAAVILKMEPVGQLLKLSAFSLPVYGAKKPIDQTRIFTQRGADAILGSLFPGLGQDVGNFPVVEDYHCIAGERPTLVMRQLAREQGANCFLQREKIVFQSTKDLMKREAVAEYHYDDRTKENQIILYRKPGGQSVLAERFLRPAFAFSEQRGFVDKIMGVGGKLLTGGGFGDIISEVQSMAQSAVSNAKGTTQAVVQGAIREAAQGVVSAALSKGSAVPLSKLKDKVKAQVPTSLQNAPSIANLQKVPSPAIDFICTGNGNITAGAVLKLKWNTSNPERPIDESLPEKVLVFAVSHWYSAQKYYSRVKGVVALEQPT